MARERRRMRAPIPLKVLTWIAGLLVAAVLAGFVLLAARPDLLANAHILRVVAPGAANPPAASPSNPPTTAAARAAAAGPSVPSATAPPSAPATKGKHHRATPVAPAGSGPYSATYTVAGGRFTVGVATSGRCWVQITSSNSPVPLVSAVEPPGKILTVPAQGTMTVQVGSSAVLVGVTLKGKSAFLSAPTVTPFTYIFTPLP